MSLKIQIQTVSKEKIRNNDVADYFYNDNGVLNIFVAEMGNKQYEALIAIHELYEFMTTEANGITEEQITNWDAYCEKAKKLGTMNDDIENGFRSESPYRKQHTQATAVEMLMAAEMNVDWIEYNNAIDKLYEQKIENSELNNFYERN